ncbi:hypothetical protein HK103_000230 [Boothiomyces macroporosus]|uniref:Uncharacterized protein n=1 Tax=Boothiomyces macroporosus TaxID=261099 RepID=A0AAD5UPW2_9FUNG|nr:hypothetical protein HK103_000230 [Boothiomyces macroporosus]
MAVMVGILIILSLIRLLRLGQSLSETDKIIYQISIDLLALGITTVNITILQLFAVLSQTLDSFNRYLPYIPFLLLTFCIFKNSFFILKLTNLFEWDVASIVQLCYLSIVIIEDNIQGIYVTLLIYFVLLRRNNSSIAKTSQYQSNPDFGFNILALHLLVITFSFERFKNMAVLKLTTKLKDGQSSPEAIHKGIKKDIPETKQKEVLLLDPDFVKEPQKNTNLRNLSEQKGSHSLSG